MAAGGTGDPGGGRVADLSDLIGVTGGERRHNDRANRFFAAAPAFSKLAPMNVWRRLDLRSYLALLVFFGYVGLALLA